MFYNLSICMSFSICGFPFHRLPNVMEWLHARVVRFTSPLFNDVFIGTFPYMLFIALVTSHMPFDIIVRGMHAN